jgi:hypothetical protein
LWPPPEKHSDLISAMIGASVTAYIFMVDFERAAWAKITG